MIVNFVDKVLVYVVGSFEGLGSFGSFEIGYFGSWIGVGYGFDFGFDWKVVVGVEIVGFGIGFDKVGFVVGYGNFVVGFGNSNGFG